MVHGALVELVPLGEKYFAVISDGRRNSYFLTRATALERGQAVSYHPQEDILLPRHTNPPAAALGNRHGDC